MTDYVRVNEGFGVVKETKNERFRKMLYVEGAAFRGWYDEREVFAANPTSQVDEDLELTFEDDEMEEDPIPRAAGLTGTLYDQFIPFGTHMVAADGTPATDDEDEEAPEVEFDEDEVEDENEQAKTSAWRDVQQKAKRIRSNNQIAIKYVDELMITGEVVGDNGTYATAVYRGGRNIGDRKLSTYKCSCKWGNWVYRRGKYFGRLCSHALAMFYELQANDSRKSSKVASLEDEDIDWKYCVLCDGENFEAVRASYMVELTLEWERKWGWYGPEPICDNHLDSLNEDGVVQNFELIRYASKKADSSIKTSSEPVWTQNRDNGVWQLVMDPSNATFAYVWPDEGGFRWETSQNGDLISYGVEGNFSMARGKAEKSLEPLGYPFTVKRVESSHQKEADLDKVSVVGREAFYGGTVVIIRDILSNNRVAVSYPEDIDNWFVVMDEDLYSADTDFSPWEVEASYDPDTVNLESVGMDYADSIVTESALSTLAAEDEDSEDDSDDVEESDDESDDEGEDSEEDDEEKTSYVNPASEDAKMARAAEEFLKQAGKAYTLEEQQALIDEDGFSHDAINSLNLEGTHYLNDDLILP